jgi:hypothetical protein
LGISAISVILDIVEIVLFARGALKPLLFLISNCVKLAIWLAWFILVVVAVLRSSGQGLNMIVSIVVL